jgi:prevent-host-death family protein
MKTVTAREANQGFSALLAEVEAGEEVVVTKHGRPVARLVPYRPPEMTAERKAAIEAAIRMMEEGPLDLGPDFVMPTRDEMHER